MGKTPDEVVSIVGAQKSSDDGDEVCFYYKEKTKDPYSEKLDYGVQVCFNEKRIADSVNF